MSGGPRRRSRPPADVLPQVKAVRDLDRARGADSRALRVGAVPVAAEDLHAWVGGHPSGRRTGVPGREHVDHAVGLSAGQDGEVGLPRRVAKSSTPRTHGVPGRESGSAMTLRSKVIRPTGKPSRPASRAPARPARASPTRSRTWPSRAVNRAQGVVSRVNGSANVRRRGSGGPSAGSRRSPRPAASPSACGDRNRAPVWRTGRSLVTPTTSTLPIPSNTSESQNTVSACMNSTVTAHGRLRPRERHTRRSVKHGHRTEWRTQAGKWSASVRSA